MMKSLIYSSVVASLLLVSACSDKDDSNPLTPTPNAQYTMSESGKVSTEGSAIAFTSVTVGACSGVVYIATPDTSVQDMQFRLSGDSLYLTETETDFDSIVYQLKRNGTGTGLVGTWTGNKAPSDASFGFDSVATITAFEMKLIISADSTYTVSFAATMSKTLAEINALTYQLLYGMMVLAYDSTAQISVIPSGNSITVSDPELNGKNLVITFNGNTDVSSVTYSFDGKSATMKDYVTNNSDCVSNEAAEDILSDFMQALMLAHIDFRLSKPSIEATVPKLLMPKLLW